MENHTHAQASALLALLVACILPVWALAALAAGLAVIASYALTRAQELAQELEASEVAELAGPTSEELTTALLRAHRRAAYRAQDAGQLARALESSAVLGVRLAAQDLARAALADRNAIAGESVHRASARLAAQETKARDMYRQARQDRAAELAELAELAGGIVVEGR